MKTGIFDQPDQIGPPLQLAIDSVGRVRLAYADGKFVPGVYGPMTTVSDQFQTRVTIELRVGTPPVGAPPPPSDDGPRSVSPGAVATRGMVDPND